MRAYALIARADGARAGASDRARAALALEVAVQSLPLAGRQRLSPENVVLVGQDDGEAKTSASRGAWVAYSRLSELGLIHPKSLIPAGGIVFDLGKDGHISGPSAGLAFLAATTCWLIEDYLRLSGKTLPAQDVALAATGILSSVSGDVPVKAVESLPAKLAAAEEAVGPGGHLLYPASNEEPEPGDGGAARVSVATGSDAVDYIASLYGVRQRRPKKARRGLRAAAAALIVAAVSLAWWYGGSHAPPPSAPADLSPPRLGVLLFREGSGGETAIVPPNAPLHAGAGIRVRLELGGPGFVYLFDVDGHGRVLRLFPLGDRFEPLPAGIYWAPPDEQWWELDETTGTERLLAAAAARRLPWLEEVDQRIAEQDALPFAEREKLVRELEEGLVRAGERGEITYVRLAFDHR